jgi:hypothetical protein
MVTDAEQLTKDLNDRGLIIEAGWQGLRMVAYPHGGSAQQMQQLREAFFAGAQHLFSSIMTVMDPGEEPTMQDLERMRKISDELQSFLRQFQAVHNLSSQ